MRGHTCVNAMVQQSGLPRGEGSGWEWSGRAACSTPAPLYSSCLCGMSRHHERQQPLHPLLPPTTPSPNVMPAFQSYHSNARQPLLFPFHPLWHSPATQSRSRSHAVTPLTLCLPGTQRPDSSPLSPCKSSLQMKQTGF